MNKCDANSDVRIECKKNATFKAGFMESLCEPRKLILSVLNNLSLKGVPFSILSPGAEQNKNDLEKGLNQIEETLTNLNEISTNVSKLAQIKQIPRVVEFSEIYCVSQTYFF